jgi:hypothetical protein
VTTTISLHGTEIPGSPFQMNVEKEAEVFVSALSYARLGPMAVDPERGVCRFLFSKLKCRLSFFVNGRLDLIPPLLSLSAALPITTLEREPRRLPKDRDSLLLQLSRIGA